MQISHVSSLFLTEPGQCCGFYPEVRVVAPCLSKCVASPLLPRIPGYIVSEHLSTDNPYHAIGKHFLDMDKFPSLPGLIYLISTWSGLPDVPATLIPGYRSATLWTLQYVGLLPLGLASLLGRLQSLDYQSSCIIHCRLDLLFLSLCFSMDGRSSCYNAWGTEDLWRTGSHLVDKSCVASACHIHRGLLLMAHTH